MAFATSVCRSSLSAGMHRTTLATSSWIPVTIPENLVLAIRIRGVCFLRDFARGDLPVHSDRSRGRAVRRCRFPSRVVKEHSL
jgi:hypothetical protein